MKYAFGFILLTAVACSPIYIPNSHNVPVFSGAREFHGNMQAQLCTPFAIGIQAQTAYSLSKNIGVLGNYAFSQTIAGGRGNLGEIGIGYFTKPSAKQYTSIFGGYGVSESDFHIDNHFYGPYYADSILTKDNANQLLSRYTKFFIQPSYGFLFSNRLQLIFSLKASRIDFDNIYSRNTETLRMPYGPTYHFEPATTLKLNFPKEGLGIFFQWGVHLTGDKQIQDSNIARFSFGLQWRLIPKKQE